MYVLAQSTKSNNPKKVAKIQEFLKAKVTIYIWTARQPSRCLLPRLKTALECSTGNATEVQTTSIPMRPHRGYNNGPATPVSNVQILTSVWRQSVNLVRSTTSVMNYACYPISSISSIVSPSSYTSSGLCCPQKFQIGRHTAQLFNQQFPNQRAQQLLCHLSHPLCRPVQRTPASQRWAPD